VVIGIGFGILFGVLSYSFAGGRRDFTSTSQVVASQYAILCAAEHAGDAERLLSQLPDDRAARVEPSSSLAGAGEPRRAQQPAAPEEPQQPPTGPTYSEMIEKQRRERLERERGQAPEDRA
jgi:hypothetical protein